MDQFKALLIKGLLHLSALLPLSVARGLGRLAGRLYWPVGGRSRKVTLHNIRAAFPEMSDTEHRALARRSLIATAETAAEMGHVWIKPWIEASQLVKEAHGTELIINALKEGRGVIGLAPHFGNWEVMGLHLATLGKTVSLYSPPTLKALGPIIEKSRKGSGGTLVPTTSRGLAKLLKSVKAGYISGVLPDHFPGSRLLKPSTSTSTSRPSQS